MHDFKKQMKQYGDELDAIRYPHGSDQLDRSIRRAMWSDTPAAGHTPRRSRHWLWPAAAAACLLLLLIPAGRTARAAEDISRVDIGGQQIWFACNRGCSPDGPIDNMNNLLI